MYAVGLAFILLLLLVAKPGVHGKYGVVFFYGEDAPIDKLRSLWIVCESAH